MMEQNQTIRKTIPILSQTIAAQLKQLLQS